MNLNDNDIKRFYMIWLRLLEFTNQKFKIKPKYKILRTKEFLKPEDLMPIRDVLWGNPQIIDEFISKNSCSFNNEEIQILESWKKRVVGNFIILKHLKNYSVFMGTEDGGKLYAVNGITESLQEMIHTSHLPLYVSTALIPFGDIIIYDSILGMHGLQIGSNIKKGLNRDYKLLKEEMGIIKAL